MYAHIACIGCTGMLRGAVAALAARCRALTLVARTDASLMALAASTASAGCTHHLLAADWSDADGFIDRVAKHVHTVGAPRLVLAWLHDDALGPRLATALAPTTGTCAFFQVGGSAAANPATTAACLRADALSSHVDYHQIILGFTVEDGTPRWLHDDEICSGVLAAITHPKPVAIVGTVVPWSAHP